MNSRCQSASHSRESASGSYIASSGSALRPPALTCGGCIGQRRCIRSWHVNRPRGDARSEQWAGENEMALNYNNGGRSSTCIDVAMNRPKGRFVITGGDRLTIAVARKFLELEAQVTIIVPDRASVDAIREDVARAECHRHHLQVISCNPSFENTLDEYCRSKDTEISCLLALDTDPQCNVRTAVMAQQLEKPVVLRTFDPKLAETVEKNIGKVRRAYSMEHLSAPSFVAAVLVGDCAPTEPASTNFMSMRAGTDYVGVCQLRVPPAVSRKVKGTLAGMTPAALANDTGCHVVARRPSPRARWRVGTAPPRGFERAREDALAPGDQILLAGPLLKMFDFLKRNNADLDPASTRTSVRHVAAELRQTRIGARVKRAWGRIKGASDQASYTWMKVLGAAFMVLTVVIAILPRRTAVDRVYTWVSSAVGSSPAPDSSKGAELLLSIALLAGAVAFGLVVCLGATLLIERRITEKTQRRARGMRGHIVVVGLNDVALRVTEILARLKIPCAVVDPHRGPGDTVPVEYVSLLNNWAPLLRGELSRILNVARIDRAMGLIGCSEDNLANLEACLHANRSGGCRSVRTVARIFDGEELSEHLEEWGVDTQLAAVEQAADAYVEAALHDLMVRSFKLRGPTEDHWMRSVRCPAGLISQAEWRQLYAHGVRAVARVDGDGAIRTTPHSFDDSAVEDEVIVAGPADAMIGLVETLDGKELQVPVTCGSRTAPCASAESIRGWPAPPPRLWIPNSRGDAATMSFESHA